MSFFKKLRKKVRNQAFTMAEQPRSLPPMVPRSGFNPFRDPPREERRPRATPVNPNIQSVRDFVVENIETGALPLEGMSMPVAPSEAGLRPRDKFRLDRGRKRLPRFLRDRMPSGRPTPRFFGGGLGSILERIFGQLEREDELRRLPFREDMPMERFPMMRPRFAAGDEVDMDRMMADQAARQGMSPAEQRMMMIQKTAADMGRTISDRDAQLFGMGEISFEEAMDRAKPSITMKEEKSFTDYQPEGALKGTFFDYIPDMFQVSAFLKDKFGSEAAESETIRQRFNQAFAEARAEGKDVFMFMGKPYNTMTLEEVEGMAEGGDVSRETSEIDKGLQELQEVAPDAMVIQQVMTMVMEMIQSGASEEQIMQALMEMGLDEEDIQQVMMMVAEEMAGQDSIDGQLSQMM